eukprot:1157969-Pelagomonas_calceolata.AAC.8
MQLQKLVAKARPARNRACVYAQVVWEFVRTIKSAENQRKRWRAYIDQKPKGLGHHHEERTQAQLKQEKVPRVTSKYLASTEVLVSVPALSPSQVIFVHEV